ncbi:hypothetical protein L873DRAFT_481136 [Choiromyces venosus 120613-1]|uniref:Uncharacterized protein n=1 Tax=Choiromyces venosus 120613-1 TaxID=1336337 RepID=A0A3N4JUM8_9PEZI|nr:hypothetical protein L873DRAFT_481136 [Choiromyces venosus 120613-1]
MLCPREWASLLTVHDMVLGQAGKNLVMIIIFHGKTSPLYLSKKVWIVPKVIKPLVHSNAHHHKIPKLSFIHISQSHPPNAQQIQILPVGWMLSRFRRIMVVATH